jgi:flagellin
MDVLGSASFVLQDETLAQGRFTNDVDALATGLRVRDASDDPGGYAIAQSIQAKVAGLQQSVTNVQTANNLLNVADGALSNAESILQRVRSLVVEARSDINSGTDLNNIQAEIDQLLDEVNRIGADTQFNGLNLLDGAYNTGIGVTSVQPGAYEVSAPIAAPDGSVGTNQVTDATGNGDPGAFVTLAGTNGEAGIGTFQPAYVVFQVISFSSNAIDPDTGIDVGPGVLFQIQAYSTDPEFGAAPLYSDTSAIAVNSGPIDDYVFNVPALWSNTNLSSPDIIAVNIANLTQNDVGATAAFYTTNGTPTPTGSALEVNDGGDEGLTVGISLPAITTEALNLTSISVLTPQTVNFMNEVLGQSSTNAISAGAAEQAVDNALTQIEQARAQIGSQVISLQDNADGSSSLIVNETASESSITDANVGQTVTQFTQEQLLINIGTSVLSQIEVSARQLTALLLNSYANLPT